MCCSSRKDGQQCRTDQRSDRRMVDFSAVLLRQKQVTATRSSFGSDEQRQRPMNLSRDVAQ